MAPALREQAKQLHLRGRHARAGSRVDSALLQNVVHRPRQDEQRFEQPVDGFRTVSRFCGHLVFLRLSWLPGLQTRDDADAPNGQQATRIGAVRVLEVQLLRFSDRRGCDSSTYGPNRITKAPPPIAFLSRTTLGPSTPYRCLCRRVKRPRRDRATLWQFAGLRRNAFGTTESGVRYVAALRLTALFGKVRKFPDQVGPG